MKIQTQEITFQSFTSLFKLETSILSELKKNIIPKKTVVYGESCLNILGKKTPSRMAAKATNKYE